MTKVLIVTQEFADKYQGQVHDRYELCFGILPDKRLFTASSNKDVFDYIDFSGCEEIEVELPERKNTKD